MAAELTPLESPADKTKSDGSTILRESFDTAAQTLRSVATKVQDSAVVGDVTQQAETFADLGKQRLAEYVRAVGGVLAQSAYSLKDTGLGGLGDGAGLLERTGAQAERFADTLNTRGSRELLSDAEVFAREHPFWFMGAAFAAGFGAARALKTAGPSVIGPNGSNAAPAPGSTSVEQEVGHVE